MNSIKSGCWYAAAQVTMSVLTGEGVGLVVCRQRETLLATWKHSGHILVLDISEGEAPCLF